MAAKQISAENIEQVVRETLAEQLGLLLPEIVNDQSLTAMGGDSLDAIETVMQIEDVFERDLDETAFAEQMTVPQFISAIKAQWLHEDREAADFLASQPLMREQEAGC